MSDSVVRIPPHSYIHILDNNLNVQSIVFGPQTYTRPDHVRIVLPPTPMVTIPPRHYCIVANPVKRDDNGEPLQDEHGQFKLRFGDAEVREQQPRFALYPGEVLQQDVTPLEVVDVNTALRLRATRDFTYTDSETGEEVSRVAAEEWLFEGPGVYVPMVEVERVETIVATIIRKNQALRLRARRACVDKDGNARRAGEEWLLRREGAYLPTVDEVVLGVVSAYVLTEKKALHLRATRSFKDVFGNERRAGEEWLVKLNDCDMYIPDVAEELVGQVMITTLTNRQFCVVIDPVNTETGRQMFGQRELRKGETSFFLLPGESLERGIQDVYVLGEDEALLLRARETFADTDAEGAEVTRVPGDLWMVNGPCEYFPSVSVEIVERRQSIPLDENEGIYVRDLRTGSVRAVLGESYMLKENEELWEKELPASVEELLAQNRDPLADRNVHGVGAGSSVARDRSRVVSYRVPHNAAVQIYDYKARQSRIIFGPELALLQPDEQFTQIVLSGGKPKRPGVIKSLVLLLGPDFMTDVVVVETSDHARLSLQLSYNWHFDVNRDDVESCARLFNIPDFVGDACKAIASRVRGAVAAIKFDDFHKNSARVIRSALFGINEQGKVNETFVFPDNNLVISSIDIQSVEPVDQRTRDSLQKSVQLAIKITTESQEAFARHEAARVAQKAAGALERQRIEDEARAEEARRELLELQAQSAAVASTGQAKAEAEARAKAAMISGKAAVRTAELRTRAAAIESAAELKRLTQHQEAEVSHQRELNELEVYKAEQHAIIQTQRFKESIEALGTETIVAMARAGVDTQARLLKGLGLKGYMVTNGDNPLNLLGMAQGMLGGAPAATGEAPVPAQ